MNDASSSGPALDPPLASRLFERAKAARWSLDERRFAEALEVSLDRAFQEGQPPLREAARYLESLHLEDLALACACADGRPQAWDHFVLQYRPALYRAADALDPSGGARDLADSLYADLYGLQEREGERQSLFRYFHGRSSLATWLRAVLAQRHVRAVAVDRQEFARGAQEAGAERGHVDVLGCGELLADAAHRARRGGPLVPGIRLHHDHLSREARIRCQEVRDRAADHAAARDQDFGSVRHVRRRRRENGFTRADSCTPVCVRSGRRAEPIH